MNKAKQLQQFNEDFEWYPTTDEIFAAVNNDVIFQRADDIRGYGDERRLNISLLDIGAGDGRIFNKLTGSRKIRINFDGKYAIEKAASHAEKLVRDGVLVIGRDLRLTTLVDKEFDVVFCNPPYSEYGEWVMKITTEVKAKVIYLVIPQRWNENAMIFDAVRNKGKHEVIGSFDFLAGERTARAKVDLIKISETRNTKDVFTKWVEDHIGAFEVSPEIEPEETEEPAEETGLKSKEEIVRQLVENYNLDMEHLLKNFQSIGEIDFRLLASLEISKEQILNLIKDRISNLKTKYWGQAFKLLNTVNSRLTHKTRQQLLNERDFFKTIDFSAINIYTVVLWIIENYNNFIAEQLLATFNKFTDFTGFKAYKSNVHWNRDSWRFRKDDQGCPERYALDYRVVVSEYCLFRSDYQGGLKLNWDHNGNIVEDLAVVASTLGYDNDGVQEHHYQLGNKSTIYTKDGKILFEFTCYKNQNIHIKMNKDFLRDFNVEVGKLNGWLKDPADVQSEFEVDEETAKSYFTEPKLQVIQNTQLLLGA